MLRNFLNQERDLPASPCSATVFPYHLISHRHGTLRAATACGTWMSSQEATLGQQGKHPTPCTPRYDKPLGRSKSFRSSRHRRHAFSELALTARATWVARSLREARRNTHREPHAVSPSLLRPRIAKAPVPPLAEQSMPRDQQSFVGPRDGLHRAGGSSKRFAKCQLSVSRSQGNSTT